MARALDLRLTRPEKLAAAEQDLAEFEVGDRVRFEQWYMPSYNRWCVVVDKKIRDITPDFPVARLKVQFPKPVRVPRDRWERASGYLQITEILEVDGKDEFWVDVWAVERSK